MQTNVCELNIEDSNVEPSFLILLCNGYQKSKVRGIEVILIIWLQGEDSYLLS